MVRVKYQGIIAGMRGKLGGSIFSATLSGNTIRTKAVPINRQTQAHSLSRSSLQQRSQEWRDLTQAERDAWNVAAPNFPRIDVFGDPYDMSGFNLYCFININRVLFGVAVTVTAPGAETVGAFTALSVLASIAADAIDITFAPSPLAANTLFLLYATRQLSPGISAGHSNFRLIDNFGVGINSPQDILNSYKAVFPPDFVAGKKIFIKALPIDDRSYQSGVAWFANAIIT